MDQVVDSEVDAVVGDPLAEAVIGLMRNIGDPTWEGTATTLYKALLPKAGFEPPREMRQGWQTPQQMSITLAKLTRGLRLQGVKVERRKSGSKRLIRLSRTQEEA